MRLTASDFYPRYRPSPCELRVYLRHSGEDEAPRGPYYDVLRRLGLRHEQTHLESFPAAVDLSGGPEEERLERTRAEVDAGSPVIYQGVLRAYATLGTTECEIVGVPDFLIRKNGSYLIRDSKISRRINDRDHPEIIRQLELYGWLYGETFGTPPAKLQVHAGDGEIIDIPFVGGGTALGDLEHILVLKQRDSEPYSPVGWSKCGGCGFHDRCWSRAESKRDVALVAGLDQGLATALRDQGIESMDQLLDSYDVVSLEELERPWGTRKQRVGKRAEGILRATRALASGEEIPLATPALPDYANYVMFDLEGLPPQLDELEKVYLWGLQVFGNKPGEFRVACAGFGHHGDRKGWEGFLEAAQQTFEEYGDIPFVHWHHYERVKLGMYVERFGDRNGIAARVKSNLLDLFPITQRSIALPLPSYSLKVVEKYVGFERELEDVAGDWAMARYIEATETEDEGDREAVMNEVRAYNQEDLAATWAVLAWLRAKAG